MNIRNWFAGFVFSILVLALAITRADAITFKIEGDISTPRVLQVTLNIPPWPFACGNYESGCSFTVQAFVSSQDAQGNVHSMAGDYVGNFPITPLYMLTYPGVLRMFLRGEIEITDTARYINIEGGVSGTNLNPYGYGISVTVGDFTIPLETPLPGALPLFATGLGALGLITYRRKRK